MSETSLSGFTAQQFKGALARVHLDLAVLEERPGEWPGHYVKWKKLKRMETVLQLAIYSKERDK